jgi:capsular exopolysaccharide synthesis family protein
MFGERSHLVDIGSPSSEPFRSLRLAVELRPETRTGKSVLVTSPNAGDGKSTIAANYALVAAINQKTLLIDADLRNPSIHEFFEFPRSPGLVELAINDSLDLEDVVHQAGTGSRLDVLTAGAALARPGDLVGSSKLADLVRQISPDYDLLIIDSPPVLVAADAASLASMPGTDVIVVVRRGGRRRPLLRALRNLELTEANVLGIVLNRDGRLSTYTY